jgi:hypothetical protein
MVSSNLHLSDKLDEIDEILKNNLISRSDPDMINRYSIENIVCSFEDMLEQASKQ